MAGTSLPLQDLWSLLPIRQMCKRLPTLRAVLADFPGDFQLVGEVVGLVYDVPVLEDEVGWEEEEEEEEVAEEVALVAAIAAATVREGDDASTSAEEDAGHAAPLAYEPQQEEEEEDHRPQQPPPLAMEEVQARLDALLLEEAWSGPQMGWGEAGLPEQLGGLWASPSPGSPSSRWAA
jgi:hypothetical protein